MRWIKNITSRTNSNQQGHKESKELGEVEHLRIYYSAVVDWWILLCVVRILFSAFSEPRLSVYLIVYVISGELFNVTFSIAGHRHFQKKALDKVLFPMCPTNNNAKMWISCVCWYALQPVSYVIEEYGNKRSNMHYNNL